MNKDGGTGVAGRQPKSARAIAVEVLDRFDPQRDYAGPILNELVAQTSEKQRATDLVFGTIRNRTAIDTVVAQFANCPPERITAKLRNIIRVGTYELVYNPQTADYSIVNEAVENAKATGGKKQTGFVNAVLRQIARHITNRNAQLTAADPRRTLPQTPETGCEFDTDFLADPQASPIDYLSICFSLPEWLIDDWLTEYGFEKTRQICFASNRKPTIYVRPNLLKTTAVDLAQRFQQAGIEADTVAEESSFVPPNQPMIRLKSPQAVEELPGFAEGLFAVQDICAAQVVNILNPQPLWKILDLCAAPGGKTVQLAEAAGDSARIIATDIDTRRLKKVEENTARLGIKNVAIIEHESLFQNSQFSILNSDFDAVLLDVPCSNTGVLARRVEARFRLNPSGIKELVKVQTELLDKAAVLVRPGGKICYSTCSIQRVENYDRLKEFMAHNPTFELESDRLILPSEEYPDHDGGYVAILRRAANPT